MNLKMISGQTYVCPAIFGDRVVRRNEVVAVDNEAAAQHLLSATHFDKLNNEHNYFAETSEKATEGLPGLFTPAKVTAASKAADAADAEATSLVAPKSSRTRKSAE